MQLGAMQPLVPPFPSGSQRAPLAPPADLKLGPQEPLEVELEFESESEDSQESGMIDNPWIRLAFFLMYEFLLLTTLLYQLRAYYMFLDGEDDMRGPLFFAALVGIALVGLPIAMMQLSTEDGIRRIWFDWAPCFHGAPNKTYLNGLVTGLLCAGFFYAIVCHLVVFTDVEAGLTRVDQVLRVEPTCRDRHLLLVEELISFDVQQGFATHAKRSLPDQIEPKILGFDNVHNVPGLRLAEQKRQTKHAWDLDYESGQLTILKFAFDIHRKAFQVRLRYLARLRGSSEPCQKGGAVCNLTDGRATVKGWWDVAVEEHVVSSLKIGDCATSGACRDAEGEWSFTATPLKSSRTQYDVEMEVPRSLGVGTEACPLAWELATRNVFWVAGSGLLVGAMAICVCGLSVPGGDKGPILIGAAGAGVLVVLAVLCFGLALTWDTFTTEY